MAKAIVNEAACENLFSEIADMAARTQEMLRQMDHNNLSEVIHQVQFLENTVCQMGWLADVALTKMGSCMRVHDGDAIKWLAAPSTNSALDMEVQHA